MLDLIAAVLCSTAVSLVMRWSEDHVTQTGGMLAVNYLTCTLCALCFCPAFSWDGTSFLCGLTMGALLVTGLILLQYNIRRHGVILSSLYTRLGILVPIICSIVLFQEMPHGMQWIGIFLALGSICLCSRHVSENGRIGISLLLLLLANGTCDMMNKVFEVFGDPRQNGLFLLIAFASAALFSLLRMGLHRGGIDPKSVFFGIGLGIPNYFSSRFLLYALQEVPAVIAYPTYSVVTIALITLAALVLWKERIRRQNAIAMAGIVCAIVLMNL
ncbi:MAG: SMR family transporter [Merdibacter sp.]